MLFIGNLNSNDSTTEAKVYYEYPTNTPTPYYRNTADYNTYYPAQQLEFNGYDCTDDCSGHEAGYLWAEENDISYPEDCDGNSDSFIEGCLSYVEEYYPEEYNEEEEYYEDEYWY